MSGSCVEKLPACFIHYFLIICANMKLMGEGRVNDELSSSFLNGRVGLAFKSKLAKVLKWTTKAPK